MHGTLTQGWLRLRSWRATHLIDAQPARTVTGGVSDQTECGPGEQLWPHGMTVEAVTWGGMPHGRDLHSRQLVS